MKRLLLLSIIVLMASTAFAALPVTFSVSVSNARTLRGEGQTEAVGVVNLVAQNTGTTTAPQLLTISYSAPISVAGASVTCTGTLAGAPCATIVVAGTPPTTTISLTVPAGTVITAGDVISIKNVRVDASNASGAVTVFASANTSEVALTGVTSGIFVGNVVRPSLSVAATAKVPAGIPAGIAGAFGAAGSNNVPFSLTTCTMNSTSGTFIDVTENFSQAFTTAGEEKILTPALTITNGTEIEVIVSGLPAGQTVIGANSVGGTATAAYLGAVVSGGTAVKATAVAGGKDVVLTWEITADDPTAVETVTLPIVFATGGTISPVGPSVSVTARVRLAPVTGSAFHVSGTDAAGTFKVVGNGSGTTYAAIPRFVDNTIGNVTLGSISDCVTNLLFPFVVANDLGFDTSIALANTSKDTLTGTAAQAGTCTFTLFPSDLKGKSTGAPVIAFTTPSIDAGGVFATSLASQAALASGGAGYGIATCNFLLAHGYAIITNGFGAPAAQPVSHGYLALVLNGSLLGRSVAPAAPEALAF